MLDELLLIVSTEVHPSDDGADVTVLSPQNTPQLYNKLIPILFVGFAHNLLVESYVSRIATISKVRNSCHKFLSTHEPGHSP